MKQLALFGAPRKDWANERIQPTAKSVAPIVALLFTSADAWR
jgi:hypothetical protein